MYKLYNYGEGPFPTTKGILIGVTRIVSSNI